MRRWIAAALAAGATWALAGAAAANDSSAELATGGLVLTKNAAVEMRSEDLYISAKEVQVRYRFANTSPKDVTLTVAFPMPDITTHGFDDLISVPTQDPVNFLAFSTKVDGQLVAAEVEQKVFARGVDRTALLRSLGVPLAPHLMVTDQAIDRLPLAKRDQLVRLGLAVVDEYDVGQGMQKHWEATWTLKTTYYWRQTFPAGRELAVEHRYQPSVGQSAGTEWGSPNYAKDPGYAKGRARYCIDDGFLAAVEKSKQPGDQFAQLVEQRIDYILSSGANWKAPIADFRMVVDKGDAANIVSFCAEGVRKISPTQFEVRHGNFTPTSDVNILILAPMPKEWRPG